MSTTIQQHLSPALISPSVCFSNDHSSSTSSPPLELYFSRSAIVKTPGLVVVSQGSSLASSTSQSGSSTDLNLIVDLSSYPLQQLIGSSSPPSCPTARQHHMVLRPRLSKIAHLTASAAMVVAPIYQVLSPPIYETIAFSDADKYDAWHGAIQDEIQALCSNNTWSLVPFHPLMNVVGSRWVYRIKRHTDGSIERYKAQLVAEGFTQ